MSPRALRAASTHLGARKVCKAATRLLYRRIALVGVVLRELGFSASSFFRHSASGLTDHWLPAVLGAELSVEVDSRHGMSSQRGCSRRPADLKGVPVTTEPGLLMAARSKVTDETNLPVMVDPLVTTESDLLVTARSPVTVKTNLPVIARCPSHDRVRLARDRRIPRSYPSQTSL